MMNSVEQVVAARHVYRIKTWLKVLYILFGLGLGGAGCFLIHGVLSSNGAESFGFWSGGGLFVVGGNLLYRALYPRLTIEGTRIEYRSATQDKTADLNEIEGYGTAHSRYDTYTALHLKGGDTIMITRDIDRDNFSREWFQQIKKLD